MSESIRVLIVEDSEADARLMLRELRRGGYDPIYERVDTPEAMSAALASQTWDIIISDYSMPRFSGLGALKLMQEKRLDLPFIMVSGKMGEETAIEAMKAGAHDYILKQNMSRLIPAIARELREAEERRGRRHAEESLRQSEERYRTLFESMMDAYVQVDMAGHLLEFNPAYQAMLGYTDDELRSLTFVELTPEPWRAFEEHIIAEQILPSGYSDVYEKEYRRKNGTIFPVELRTFLLRDTQGQPAAMWAIVRDITERKQAEEALLDSERRYRQLYENIRDGSAVVDMSGVIVDNNKQFQVMLGYTPDELRELTYQEITPEKWHQMESEIIEKQVMTRGYSDLYEKEYRSKDGTVFPVELRTHLLQDRDGRVTGMWAVVRDITERKRAENELRESEEMLRLVLNSIPAFVFWKDRNSVYMGCNYLFAKNAGLDSAEEIIGKTDYDLPWKYTEADIYRADDRVVISTGVPKINYEETQHTADGRLTWVRTSKTPLMNSDGEIIGVLGTFEDITQRKQAEERLYKLNRTLTMLSSVNELLIRARDESGLLHEACRIIVEQGGYAMAWVGLAENDQEKTVRPVAHCGREEGYLDTVKITWSDTVLGQGPTGTAIRTGLSQIVHDIRTEPSYAPWREEALKRGYGSAIAVPLLWDGKGIGAIDLYLDEPDSISKEEIDLLTELASDMIYGVMSLRARSEAASAEAHKRDFYRRTILAATEGKLIVCERDDVVRIAGPVIASWDVRKSESLSIMRNEIARIAADAGMEEHRLSDFVLCIGEAATNAFKHAGGGAVSLHKRDDAMIAVVSDQGPGIEALVLPELAFKRGYTTAASLGMGYKAMISMADKLYLATGPGGTTVGIEMGIHAPQTPSLIDSLPDVF